MFVFKRFLAAKMFICNHGYFFLFLVVVDGESNFMGIEVLYVFASKDNYIFDFIVPYE